MNVTTNETDSAEGDRADESAGNVWYLIVFVQLILVCLLLLLAPGWILLAIELWVETDGSVTVPSELVSDTIGVAGTVCFLEYLKNR